MTGTVHTFPSPLRFYGFWITFAKESTYSTEIFALFSKNAYSILKARFRLVLELLKLGSAHKIEGSEALLEFSRYFVDFIDMATYRKDFFQVLVIFSGLQVYKLKPMAKTSERVCDISFPKSR